MIKFRYIFLSVLVLPGYVMAQTNSGASTNWFQDFTRSVYNKAMQIIKPATPQSQPTSSQQQPTGVATQPQPQQKSNVGNQKQTQAPQQGVDKNADEKDTLIKQIQEHLFQGDFAGANKLLDTYKSKFGEDVDYKTEKARSFALSNNPQPALAILEPLLKKDPTNQTLLDIKNYAITHPATTTTISSNLEFTEISPEVQEANLASGNGDYQKAIDLYKQILTKNPNDKVALIGLARTYLLMDKDADGEHALAQYKQKYGEDDDYLTEKARDLAFRDNPQQALKVLAPLLAKDPSNDVLLDIKDYATARLKLATVANQSTNQSTNQSNGAAASPLATANMAAATARMHGTNPQDYAVAAQAYLDANDKGHALVMINHALRLAPNNTKYLILKADIADQLNDKNLKYRIYQQLYAMDPTNTKYMLGLARATGDLNMLERSAHLYEHYLDLVPNDKKAWLEYAYIQSFRGNDTKAIRVLDKYHARFGDSDDYLATRARIVASATRFTESFAIVNKLLPRLPNNYDLNYANTTDFYYNNQPIEMYQSFNKVKQIEPDSDETNGLWSFINTPYRSNIGLDAYHSFDTDTVKISRFTLYGQYFLTPCTSIIGNVTEERLSASISSGLNPVKGGHAVYLPAINIGVNQRLNPKLAVQGMIGGQNASNGKNSFNYEADAFANPSETLGFIVQLKRAFYDESARSVSLGVRQNLGQVTVNWQPCLQCYLTVAGSYSTFSDGNTMRWVNVLPGVQVISSENFNVKLGIDAQYEKFGKQLTDGYYNPSNYKYASGVLDIYYKHSDNVGYEATVGLGTQHDETFTTWKPADDFSLKAFIGIYQDWYLTLTGGLSTRGRSIAANPGLGTYRVYGFDASLTRRF